MKKQKKQHSNLSQIKPSISSGTKRARVGSCSCVIKRSQFDLRLHNGDMIIFS